MNCLIVNGNRIFIGTIKNVLDTDKVIDIPVSRIENMLMPQISFSKGQDLGDSKIEGKLKDKSGLSNSDLKNAQNEISSLLDDDEDDNEINSSEVHHSTPPIYESDIIFFQLNNNDESVHAHIKLLRKSCAFRDVPIVIVADLNFAASAKNYIEDGATNVLLFPQDADKIQVDINNFMRPIGSNVPVITKLINPFIDSTLSLISTMAKMDAKRKDLFLKKNYRLFGDISGIMNFSGNIDGSVVVSFGRELASRIISKVMGIPENQLDEGDLKEGVGEFVNIIAGNAKAVLAKTEFEHEISLPVVVSGFGHEIVHKRNTPVIVVIFEVEYEKFAVQVCME